MIYYAHRLAAAAVPHLPGAADAPIVGCTPLAARLWPAQWRAAGENARVILAARRCMGRVDRPAQGERALVAATFRNYTRYMLELARLPHLGAASLERRFEVHGWPPLAAALAHGRGVVLAGLHMGNWDAAGMLLAARGVEVAALVDTLAPPRWDAEVQRTRARLGVLPIPAQGGAPAALRALRRGAALGVLVDRPLAAGGVDLSFLGRPARVPVGAARLALLADAAFCAGVVVRRGGRLVAHLSPPLTAPAALGPREQAAALIRRAFAWFEPFVLRYPDQWFMFRPFWRAEAGTPEQARRHASPSL